MAIRKVFFWIHLVIGVAVSVVVLMMSVTGVLLTYEMQLDRWALRDYRAPPPSSFDQATRDVALIDQIAS